MEVFPSDKGMFELSNYAVAVNPKGNIADSADSVVNKDLNEAVALLKQQILQSNKVRRA